MVGHISNNPLLWPWYVQLPIGFVVGVELIMLWLFRPARVKRELRRALAAAGYKERRRQRSERRVEDLLWAIHREPAYEVAVDLALERAVADAIPFLRTARAERAHAHLQVVA